MANTAKNVKLYSALIRLGSDTNHRLIVTHDLDGTVSGAWTKISGAYGSGLYYVNGRYVDGDVFVRAVIAIDDAAWPMLGSAIDYGVIAHVDGNAIWGVGGDTAAAVISNGNLQLIEGELDYGLPVPSLQAWVDLGNKDNKSELLDDEADLTDTSLPYPEYGDVSSELGHYYAKLEQVHRSVGVTAVATASIDHMTAKLYAGLSDKARAELKVRQGKSLI